MVFSLVREYDLYVPSTYNDGREIEPQKIAELKRILVRQFGGLTHFPQENEGLWKVGNVTFRDRITILRVLAEDCPRADEFLRSLKPSLLDQFGQEEVLIVCREVQIL